MIENNFNREEILKVALDAYPNKLLFDEDEFKKHFNFFFVVRKMARRFANVEKVNEMLLLNNIIITLNIFGILCTNFIFNVICTREEFSVIKSCLIFLKSLNPNIESIEHSKKMLKILNAIKHDYIISPKQ